MKFHGVRNSKTGAALALACLLATWPLLLAGQTTAGSKSGSQVSDDRNLKDPLSQNGCVGCVGKKSAATKNWTPPRTSWGDPDLQGKWNNATITPFQRPDKLGEKSTLESEEADEFADSELAEISRNRRDGRGTAEDVDRAYNDHWMDHGTVVSDHRTSLITDPPDGRIPPLTPEAKKKAEDRQAATADMRRRFADGMPWNYKELGMGMRCIIRQDQPPYRPSVYNNNYHIFQSPGYVVILVEMIHHARIIPLDGRGHLNPNLHQWLGDSRGHWEDNTLVIETSNFRPEGPFGGASADSYKIVEKYTLVDADTIHYEFRIEDPKTWTKPWSGMIPWNRTDGEIYEYACHEGNYDMVHFLQGARKREQLAAGEAAKQR